MAVWLALSLCDHVSVYGFGTCKKRNAAEAVTKSAGRRGVHETAVYYDPYDKRGKLGFAGYHNYTAEWKWLNKLQRKRVLSKVC